MKQRGEKNFTTLSNIGGGATKIAYKKGTIDPNTVKQKVKNSEQPFNQVHLLIDHSVILIRMLTVLLLISCREILFMK